jgi:hypothetical protein
MWGGWYQSWFLLYVLFCDVSEVQTDGTICDAYDAWLVPNCGHCVWWVMVGLMVLLLVLLVVC